MEGRKGGRVGRENQSDTFACAGMAQPHSSALSVEGEPLLKNTPEDA